MTPDTAPGTLRRSPSPLALRALGAVAGLTLAVTGACSNEAPGPLDRGLYDEAVNHVLPRVKPGGDVVVLEVDDHTLDMLGERWPLSRTTWARMFRVLASYAPRAVAVDVVFDQPAPQEALALGEEVLEDLRASGLTDSPAGTALAERLEERLRARDEDARLAEALSEAGNVILGGMALTGGPLPAAFLSHARPQPLRLGGVEEPRLQGQDVVGSIAPLLVAARGTGTLNMLVESDGVIRRYPYLVGTPGEVHASLALATALRLMPERAESLIREALATDDGAPLMRLPSAGWLPRLSVGDVLAAKPGDPALTQALRDKVVFIGVTAAGLHGQVTLPGLVAVPGVEIHAFALENLRTGGLMRTDGLAAVAGLVETALLLAALVLLGGRTRTLRQVLLAGLGLGVLHVALALGLATGPGWVVPLVPALVGLGGVLLLETGLRIAELKQQRGALRRLFVRYPQAPAPGPNDTGPTD